MSLGEHKNPHADEDTRGIWADELYWDKEFYDDVTSKQLSHELTTKARELEMKFFWHRRLHKRA